jgi:hypothetical protein
MDDAGYWMHDGKYVLPFIMDHLSGLCQYINVKESSDEEERQEKEAEHA